MKKKEILSARMAFDRINLKPLYRLETGKAGDSCALYIAKRLGMPAGMLAMAAREAYGGIDPRLREELQLGEEEGNGPVGAAGAGAARQERRAGGTEGPGAGGQEQRTGASEGADFQAERPGTPSAETLPGIRRMRKHTAAREGAGGFARGDSVTVGPEGSIGIVVEPADLQGNVLVQVKKEKLRISHKRLKLKVAASELYPEDYDFSILFDTVENRKARRLMERKHQEGLEIVSPSAMR